MTPEQRARTQLLAIAPDSPEDIGLMADRVLEDYDYALDFPLLSDDGSAITNRYGLLNEDDGRGRQIPHPTTYVIDMEGTVRWKFTEVDYRIRPEHADILAALNALEPN